jgi:tetratricopeptide (TPR) repeat protein
MRKLIFLIAFSFTTAVISWSAPSLLLAETENEDAFLAILALNYCHMSLYKITEYNDRIILDEEYSNIINNINLSKIKDTELISVLKKLMDVLTEFKLDERSKDKLFKQYEKNLQGALYSEMGSAMDSGADKSISTATVMKNLSRQSNVPNSSQVVKNIAAGAAGTAATGVATATVTGPGAPIVAAAVCAVVLVQAGSAYMDYRNAIKEYRNALDEAVWKLDTSVIARINDINKTFLETYWKLLTKYEAPDRWRLTLDQFKDYFAILKDKDEGRKYRNLVRMEKDLELFPPYWYFRGAAAQKTGEKDDVLRCYAMYQKVRKGFFRQDKTYSSVIMLKVVETDYTDNQELLFTDLQAIVKQDRKDWRKRLFCAYKLIEYGHFQKAKEQVQANIDNGTAVSVSRKALGDIYYLQNDKEHLGHLIDKTISDDNGSNQEVFYLIGKLPAEEMLLKIRDQIVGINADIETHVLGKDDLILHIPQKWILDDPKNLSIKMIVGETEYKPNQGEVDKERKETTFVFEDALDSADLLEREKSLSVAFSLNTETGKVRFFSEIKPVTILMDKGYTDKGLDFAKSMTSKIKAKVTDATDDFKAKEVKEEKTLRFCLKRIQYLDACFQVSDDNQILRCASE